MTVVRTSTGIDVVWSDHATVRTRERTGTWGRFRNGVEAALEAREWEEWFEVDTREGRGLRTNLLVRSDNAWALARLGTDGRYVVCSVLTNAQYDFNARNLWRASAAAALGKAELDAEQARSGPVRPPLKHNPFAKLLK